MKMISVFQDDFSSPKWQVKGGGWEFSDGAAPTCTGGYEDFSLKHVLYLPRLYGADRRRLRLRVEFGADTVLNLHTFRTDQTGMLPNESEFVVDFKNQRLAMCALCDERFIYERRYVCESEFSLEPGIYTVELEKDDCMNILRIRAEERCFSLRLFGEYAGCQQGYYGFSLREGEPCRLLHAEVFMMDRPKICFVGDSITEGARLHDMDGRESRSSCYSRILREKIGDCLISAAGSDCISQVLEKFESEYRWIRPEYLCVLIGTNGSDEGNSAEQYNRIVEACRRYGIHLILNHIPPTDYCDYRTRNRNIDATGAIGFATEQVLLRDGTLDRELFTKDEVHPNAAGHRAMAEFFYPQLMKLLEKAGSEMIF